MNIKIYQINMDRDKNRVKFLGISPGKAQIDSSIYDEVFSGVVDCENLEDVYTMFNLNPHPLHRGHSLSVSDIVVNNSDAHFCDSFGFTKVDFEESLTHKPDNLMKVVYVEPNKPPFVSDLENSLKAEQRAIGGRIEPIYMGNDVCLVGNEEAKLIGMPGNRRIGDGSTIIAGPFFVVGVAGEDFRSLTDEEVEKYMDVFAEPEEISQDEVESDTGFTIYSM